MTLTKEVENTLGYKIMFAILTDMHNKNLITAEQFHAINKLNIQKLDFKLKELY